MATLGLFGVSGFYWIDQKKSFWVECFSTNRKVLIEDLREEIKPRISESGEFEDQDNNILMDFVRQFRRESTFWLWISMQ